MAAKKTTTKQGARKAATTRRRTQPTAKQLAVRRKFALMAKARAKAAKTKKAGAARRRNKTIIKAKRVLVLNPGTMVRRKIRNSYMDLVIRGTAEKTPQGWKVGRKVIAQGKGIATISSGYYLDKATGTIFAKRARNVAAGFYDGSGVFHPIRSAADYDGGVAGETGGKPRRTRSKKKQASARKASATARHRASTKARKATTSRLASRSLFRSVPLKKKRRNPNVKELRETFSGTKSRKTTVLNAPNGTPAHLAKLGKLVLIKTQSGTIKPASGTTWLCADAKGKLHLATSAGSLYDGAAGSFGKVLKIEYEARKPHLGHPNLTVFFHPLGELDGIKPELIADGKGGLKFRGGNYKITREGIVN